MLDVGNIALWTTLERLGSAWELKETKETYQNLLLAPKCSWPKQQPNNVFLVNKKKDLNAGPSGWSRPDGDAAGAAVARSNVSEHLAKFWNINFPLTFYKKNTTSPSVAAASAAMRLGTARTPTINFQNIHTRKNKHNLKRTGARRSHRLGRPGAHRTCTKQKEQRSIELEGDEESLRR